MSYDLTKGPIGILNLDLEDFRERGIDNPTDTEIEEVVGYLRRYYQYDGDWEEQLAAAMELVLSKRDLF